MKKHLPLILALGLFANHLIADESYSAKSLFFGEDPSSVTNSPKMKNAVTSNKNKVASTPAKKTTMALGYSVKLKQADGSFSDVPPNRIFKSGEQFQIGIKVNEPSYVYVYNKAPNGTSTLIYPSNGKKESFVNSMGTVFLPTQGSFAFDNEPGTEVLTVYMSKKPVNKSAQEVDKIRSDVYVSNDQVCLDDRTVAGLSVNTSRGNNTDNMVASNDVASKAIVFADDKNTICKAAGGNNDFASKGIFFAEEGSQNESGNGIQPVAYVAKVVDPKKNAELKLTINLKHQ